MVRKKCPVRGCKVYPRKGCKFCSTHRNKKIRKVKHIRHADLTKHPRLVALGKRIQKYFYG